MNQVFALNLNLLIKVNLQDDCVVACYLLLIDKLIISEKRYVCVKVTKLQELMINRFNLMWGLLRGYR